MKLAMLGAGTGALTQGDLRMIGQELAMEKGSQRDKMALASIAFCSPLMLLGMGATLALMDDMSMSRFSRLETSLRNRVQLQKHELNAQADASARAHAKKLATSLAPLPVVKLGEKKQEAGEKKKTLLSALNSDQAALRPEKVGKKVARDSLKLKKLEKERAALSSYMENMRGKLSLKSASNILARIEQLDKAIRLQQQP
jgi:hypothetical protein